MNDEVAKFAKTLDPEHLNEALEIRSDLKKKNLAAGDKSLNVNITDLFLSGFKKFPQMAQYDYTTDQIQILEGAQSNLNDNIGNERLRNTLIQTAKEVAGNLQQQYPDVWENPLKA